MVDAREYHERTKHSPASIREGDFSLDFANKPRPYKVYEDRPGVELPGSPTAPDEPLLSAIATPTADPAAGAEPGAEPGPGPGPGPPSGTRSRSGAGGATIDAGDVHALCHYATGVTKELTRDGRRTRFRAAACTGKLYHVDLYVVAGDLDGLDAGVYHFDPHTGSLDALREGDYRGTLAAAAGGRESVATAPVTFLATSEWWRNAWKYRERTYRHAFWDSGTILANLLAVAHGGGHRAEVVAGFVDDAVARLLGVDPAEEAPLELVPVGSGDPAPDARPADPIDPATAPPSDEVVDYPLVPDAWRQSRLADGEAVRAWREDVGSLVDDPGHGDHGRSDAATLQLDPVDAETASGRPVGATIERRGSLREYGHQPISRRKFATVLDRALVGVPTDSTGAGGGTRLLDYYCLVHAVEGIPAGAYRYHPRENVLERVGETDRGTAGHLALDQSVVGDAAANVYAMADVDRLVDAVGNRGYRLAQLLGGIALGRLYLATYAHRTLGGRGFTFYDDRVTGHLSPHAAGLTPMTLFALGSPADGGS